MGRLDATSLAHKRSVLATNPAAARGHSHICDSITNWCFSLVRRQDPARLPPASEALGGARGIGGRLNCTSHSTECLHLPPTHYPTHPAFVRNEQIDAGAWVSVVRDADERRCSSSDLARRTVFQAPKQRNESQIADKRGSSLPASGYHILCTIVPLWYMWCNDPLVLGVSAIRETCELGAQCSSEAKVSIERNGPNGTFAGDRPDASDTKLAVLAWRRSS